jgi:hypothetical protein
MAKYELNIEIEDDEVEAFEQEHELDGIAYLLRFAWNRRDESWNLSIYALDETLLAGSRKIAIGYPMLFGEVSNLLPPGMLLAVDLTEQDEEPARLDFGKRVILVYYDEDELAE